MFRIVLIQPKIPQNVGSIGRTCVALGASLDIVGPIPFVIDDKHLKRAGMDYWYSLDVKLWESTEEYLSEHPLDERCFFATTKASKPHFAHSFLPSDRLFFGSEDSGLPSSFWQPYERQAMRLPMRAEFRSLNLSNAVSVVVYEAVRQNYDKWEAYNG